MKLFHLSDLHIGLKLMNRDLSGDQDYILRQIVTIAGQERPDAIVIAGDIYDKAVPSAEAVDLFDGFVTALTEALPETAVMMISGNHDSAPRVDCFRNVLKRQRLYMIGKPPMREGEFIEQVVLTDEYGPIHFYLLPFVKPSMVREITGTDEKGNALTYHEALKRLIERETIDPSVRNVLVSHQFYLPSGMQAEDVERMDSEMRTVGNIDEVGAQVIQGFDYAALGHIHKPMKVGGDRWRYCGTPMPCSVSEAGQKKGIVEVVLGPKGVVDTKVLPLKPLHEIRVLKGTLSEVLSQACSDYVTVILTDPGETDGLQDRLRQAFPGLLEIRREAPRAVRYDRAAVRKKALDPFELCCSFLPDISGEEKEVLLDVIHTVEGVK